MNLKTTARLLGGVSFVAAAMMGQVIADDLVMGRTTPQVIMDPHVSVAPNANAVTNDIFDRLASFEKDFAIAPALATSWEAKNPTTWVFHLREGVTFHDGTPFTSADVVYSLNRAKAAPAAGGGSVAVNMAGVTEVRAVDDFTVEVDTAQPNPLLIELVGRIYIIPAHLGAEVTTENFNAGETVIGTGPYKFESWIPNEQVVLSANDEYWGAAPEWENVTARFITDPAARVAALLSGQVDVIDSVPPADLETLEKSEGVELFTAATTRMLHFYLDAGRDVSPQVTDLNGNPLADNPLKDHRVRLALSRMIDRDAIVARIMNGQATPASQPAFEGQGGFIADYPPTALDLEGAKALLAEAGYPDGFGVTLNCATDRDINTPLVVQAVAQFFTRGGIKINGIDCQPFSVNSAGAEEQKYSINIWGRNDSATDITSNLRNSLVNYDPEKGLGGFNRGRYSNPEFDAMFEKAQAEFDLDSRYALLADAARLAMDDTAIIPLYFLTTTWATRDGITFEANPLPVNDIKYAHPAAE